MPQTPVWNDWALCAASIAMQYAQTCSSRSTAAATGKPAWLPWCPWANVAARAGGNPPRLSRGITVSVLHAESHARWQAGDWL